MTEVERPILVFFDGDCVTCHRAVMFLMRRKARARFRFVPLKLLVGTSWEDAISQELGMDLEASIVVVKNGKLLARSSAIFCLISALGWPWRPLLLGRLVPGLVLDWAYNAFARIRYRIFGKSPLATFCEPLPPELRKLVLTEVPDDHFFCSYG
jgi:predicted DCC family thiol-disulfide oxidoreductase YuxK